MGAQERCGARLEGAVQEGRSLQPEPAEDSQDKSQCGAGALARSSILPSQPDGVEMIPGLQQLPVWVTLLSLAPCPVSRAGFEDRTGIGLRCLCQGLTRGRAHRLVSCVWGGLGCSEVSLPRGKLWGGQ